MTKDWKQHLEKDDENRLNEILHKIEIYRNAYRKSDDIKANQFWAALLEHNKQNKSLLKRIELVEVAASRKERPIVVEKIVKEKKQPSYWQLPVGAVPLLLSVLILANITLAESQSQLSFAGSLAIAFVMIVFAGVIWYSTFMD